jgi:AcrR family transcriptional regulator
VSLNGQRQSLMTTMKENAIPLREEIKNTARRLFSDYGYEQTTVENILEELSLPGNLFFSLFPSKDELLEELWSE